MGKAFYSYEEAFSLSDQDGNASMAAPNKQPIQKRPGPKAVNTHAPFESGNPGSQAQSPAPKGGGVAGHGTPKGTGKNPRKLR